MAQNIGVTPANQPFPVAPLSLDLRSIQNWCNAVRNWANQFSGNFNVPGPVGNATAVANELIVTIKWVPAKNAAFYWIYRGSTGDFLQATLIGQLASSKTQVATYQYIDTQNLTAGTQYYWIVPLNERLQAGAKSPMLSVMTFDTSSAQASLANNVTTSIFELDLAAGSTHGQNGGGIFSYSISTYDGTNIQVTTGIEVFNFGYSGTGVFSGGTGAIGSPILTGSGGTQVITFGIATSARGPVITVNANSSLSFDSMIFYSITNLSPLGIALL